MTVDLTTVKAGDKLHTRRGDVLVVYESRYETLCAADYELDCWKTNGKFSDTKKPHSFDIIRIEKREPVVQSGYFSMLDTYPAFERVEGEPVYKITITDGVPNIERVEATTAPKTKKHKCRKCQGTGRLTYIDYSNGQGLDREVEEDCDECEGTGSIEKVE